jgi:hypothetical protein
MQGMDFPGSRKSNSLEEVDFFLVWGIGEYPFPYGRAW